MLTAREHAASLEVLRALRAPVCASVVLTWDVHMSCAYVRLARMGYVESLSSDSRGAFRWDRVVATDLGRTYLEQIERSNAQTEAR